LSEKTSTKRGRVRSKTYSATPSIINILARTEDDQVSRHVSL